MLRTQLLFVNLKCVQIIGLRRFLASRFPKDERNVIQHRAQIRIREIVQLRAGCDGFFVVANGFLRLPKIVAQKCEATRQAVKRALIGRSSFLQNGVRFEKIGLGLGAVTALIKKLAKLFVAECERALVVTERALGQLQKHFGDANRLRHGVGGAQHLELLVEYVPKLLLAFHYQPSLNWLTKW